MREICISLPTRKGGETTVKAAVATNWNELTRQQLTQVVRLLYSVPDKHLRQRCLLQTLLGLKPVQFNALPAWAIYELRHLTAFLHEDNTLTRQLLPVLRLRRIGPALYGPADLLLNLTFSEFITAEKHLFRYLQSQRPEHLRCLVATLYRPRRWCHRLRKSLGFYHGDNRAPFNEHLVESRAPRLARVPEAEQLAVLTWYRGCRNALERLYPHVFSAEGSESGTAQASGWEPVLRGMAGGKFGNVANTGRTQAHQLLREMNEQLQHAAEMRRKHTQPS